MICLQLFRRVANNLIKTERKKITMKTTITLMKFSILVCQPNFKYLICI